MNGGQVTALMRLFDEIPALFQRLRAVAGDVHGRDVPSAGLRGVLRSLDRLGPQTVPQLARARPVSRQHIQVLVNALLEDGLVATEENPAHRKSPLLGLTAKGKRQLRPMHEREMELLANARLELPAKDLERVSDTLGSLRSFLESKEWSRYVAGSD
jgi:DNA-binding MarR family transcriptional regulator